MKHFDFEYGAGTMGAELPDNTDVFIPGVTVEDPRVYSGGRAGGCLYGEPAQSDRYEAGDRACAQGAVRSCS